MPIHFVSSKTEIKQCVFAFLTAFFFAAAVSANPNALKEVPSTQSIAPEATVDLTQEEQAWLAEHKNIRVAYDGSLPPYSFINQQGKVDGVAFEIISILGKRLGINFIINGDANWNRLYRVAAKRQVDVVATMVDRPDRYQWFSFTKPYLTKSLVIVTKQDNTSIHKRSDLAGKKIAVVKGYQYGEQVGHDFPNAKRVKVSSMLDSLKQVEKGNVDAAILFLGTANYLQAENKMTQLKITAFYDRNSADESIAVRKDWPILTTIFQKGLDGLTEQEVQRIFAKWVVQGGVIHSEEEIENVKKAQVVPQFIKKPDEIKKQPVNISIQQPVPKPKSFFNRLEINNNLLLALLGILVLWFIHIQRQKKWRKQAYEHIMASYGDLPQKKKEGTKITIVIPISLGNGSISSKAQLEQSLELNCEQSNVSKETEFDKSPANESIRYLRDTEGRFSYVSSSIKDVLGFYSEAEFIENYRQYLTENPANHSLSDFVDDRQGQPNDVYQIEIYDVAGGTHWLEVRDTPIYDGEGHCIGIEGVMRDITDQITVGESSSKSETDAKINSLNTLQDVIQSAIESTTAEKKSFSLICISLDRLRILEGVKDSSFDKEVLEEAGKRLRATLRDSDTLVVLEANKFALILHDADSHSTALIMDKIKNILQVPYLAGIQSIVLDVLLGVAIYPTHGLDPDSLIKGSQKLLNTDLSDSDILNKILTFGNLGESNLKLQQDLVLVLDECKVALRAMSPRNINTLHRHSQFTIHYQSRHDVQDYVILGFEALIRWQHPQFGQLLPADFISLVKDIGLLDVMTYWIIQQVSFQAMVWDKKRIRPKLIAINLNGLATNQAVEVAKVSEIIKGTGAKPEWFTFSIPEAEVAGNQELVIPMINQFVEAGFAIAIDNFGADSQILQQLKTIPAQMIEFDSSLIRYLPENIADAEVVATTIAMLHGYGKTVLAKDVETEQQMNFLKSIDCDLVQGYLLSKPLPAKEAKELIESLPDVSWYLKAMRTNS